MVKRRLTILTAFSQLTAGAASVRLSLPGNFMRTALIGLAALLFLAPAIANAEQHMFLVANDADGYGIDRCLASGEKCGAAAANAYCKTQGFAAVRKFHKADRDDLTGAITKDGAVSCQPGTCDVVAIVCLR